MKITHKTHADSQTLTFARAHTHTPEHAHPRIHTHMLDAHTCTHTDLVEAAGCLIGSSERSDSGGFA